MSEPMARVWFDKDGWSWMLLRDGKILNSGHEDTEQEADEAVALAMNVMRTVDWIMGR